MKFSFLSILFLTVVLVSCGESENNESKAFLFEECPRTDLEWVLSDNFKESVTELANELTNVINCGKHSNLPICEENGLFEDSATITLEIWCSATLNCVCNYFPNGFSIAEQDAMIEEAKALMAIELTVCGIENAIYEFEVHGPNSICVGNGIEIELRVSATAFCCASVE